MSRYELAGVGLEEVMAAVTVAAATAVAVVVVLARVLWLLSSKRRGRCWWKYHVHTCIANGTHRSCQSVTPAEVSPAWCGPTSGRYRILIRFHRDLFDVLIDDCLNLRAAE